MKQTELSIAITGAGGAGVISVGELLLQAWAREGGRGLLRKAFGPQIRGGESAALLKLTESERYTAASAYQVLLAFDWNNYTRFGDEIKLAPGVIVFCEDAGDVPESVLAAEPTLVRLPMKQLAEAAHDDGRVNMLALGLLGQLMGLGEGSLVELALQKLAHKPAAYQEAAEACIAAGCAQQLDCSVQVPAPGVPGGWYISGNQAAGLGALEAGIRFVAAYPITPASDVLEWMAGGLEQLGGNLVQAEDELAAINMTIGAAFGGVPSFTATSGPGLALMTESIGLAVASETPITVLNVMRGGPSTGIPTKSEQSDLNIALHGLHGDAPHLVLAPLDIADCVYTSAWAVQLAQHLQTAAIVLSDQFIGQSTAVITEPVRCAPLAPPVSCEGGDNDYLRYRLTDSGVSTMAVPGDPGLRFTADGLEHNEQGTPSARDDDHQQQLAKRARKLNAHDYGDDWARIDGEGSLGLVCFGSASAAVAEAAELLAEQGVACRTVSLRLLAPLQHGSLTAALADCERVLVVEQNHGGQLYRYLRGQMDFTQPLHSYARPGPVPLSGAAIVAALAEVSPA
ncbi:2-oxoacid:acceptor oxidoreductase subunit alpha [Pseudohalioglobus lutimaris]|uniref:2-oxoacid:acceptor oxidoreductase subunit alpha n=1 Tax=Pseudohalioglobus lutimaris TaxID=1737061 RepID=A0A2N5WZN8_9GAMM|nr:2-oxoacid:acceptor oxidoreductase subunit alpha [Pseudohalioglobus lutimaris]PLW67697.1 2-oxoacid:acceptor oxidoreductase subunit alpha [Pseudohalioglobus lutimaris]